MAFMKEIVLLMLFLAGLKDLLQYASVWLAILSLPTTLVFFVLCFLFVISWYILVQPVRKNPLLRPTLSVIERKHH